MLSASPTCGRAAALTPRCSGRQVVLYSNKHKTSTLYKSLSLRFKERLSFAEVRESAAKELVAAEGITSFPSLVLIGADGSRAPFEGEPGCTPARGRVRVTGRVRQ